MTVEEEKSDAVCGALEIRLSQLVDLLSGKAAMQKEVWEELMELIFIQVLQSALSDQTKL